MANSRMMRRWPGGSHPTFGSGVGSEGPGLWPSVVVRFVRLHDMVEVDSSVAWLVARGGYQARRREARSFVIDAGSIASRLGHQHHDEARFDAAKLPAACVS